MTATTLPTLTELEKDVLGGILNSEYAEGYHNPETWSFAIRAQKTTSAQVSGVVSSLVKKGLVRNCGTGRDSSVILTTAGLTAARAAGIQASGY